MALMIVGRQKGITAEPLVP